MNWKKIWSYFEKIVYVILLIVSIEQGWWVWFVLGSTAWLCLFYHKQLYNTMKYWSEMMMMVYDGYVMQQELKCMMKQQKSTTEYKKENEPHTIIDANVEPVEQSSTSSTTE